MTLKSERDWLGSGIELANQTTPLVWPHAGKPPLIFWRFQLRSSRYSPHSVRARKRRTTMGKRRKHTAKTGDKALYKSLPNVSENAAVNSDDDTMYNAVDRFHNQRDFLKLDAGASSSESEEDDGISRREGVLDLAAGESSSSSSSEEDDDDGSIDERAAKKHEKDFVSSSEDEDSPDSEEDDEMLQMEQADVRDWGNKKSSYYHGDTADLEIGQDEEDAYLEEEAAKDVEAKRYEQMEEEDFVMSEDEEEKKPNEGGKEKKPIDLRGTRDLSKLSKSDRSRLLQSHHPELLPLVSHFKHAAEEWDNRTSVAAKAILEGDDGTIEVSCFYTKEIRCLLLHKHP